MSFFKKKLAKTKKAKIKDDSSAEAAEKPKMECNDDPDCPMCHISPAVIQKLQQDK